jgi:hypothetical protein
MMQLYCIFHIHLSRQFLACFSAHPNSEDTQSVWYVMQKDHWFLGYVWPYFEVGDRGV